MAVATKLELPPGEDSAKRPRIWAIRGYVVEVDFAGRSKASRSADPLRWANVILPK
jgi:hypothetical protein